jgi:hypothetical protein
MKLPSACSWLALLSAAHAAIAAVGPLAHDDPLLNRSAVHARNAACATQNQCDGPRMARRRANALQARSGLVSRDQRNNPDNVFDSAHWNRLSYQNPNGGSWQQIYDCVFAGYSHHVSSTNGDSVTVYFSGTGFNLIGEARSSGGVGQVWVDDKVVALYDSYAPYGRPQYNLLTIDGLSDGGHKLVLKNNLIKGGPNGVGGGTTISFDALEVTRTTGEPAWTGIPITAAKRVGSRWGAWVKGDISSALWSTWGAGDYAQFTFTGTGFRVFTAGKSDGVYGEQRATYFAPTHTNIAQLRCASRPAAAAAMTRPSATSTRGCPTRSSRSTTLPWRTSGRARTPSPSSTRASGPTAAAAS